MSGNIVVMLIVLVGAVTIIKGTVRVPEHQRLVIFRLGRKLEKPKGPGLVFVIPIADHVTTIDLRERMNEISLTAITKDFVVVSVILRMSFSVVDLEKFAAAIGRDPKNAVGFETVTTVIEELDSTELSNKLIYLNKMLLIRLNELFRPLGTRAISVEILSITIDDQLQKMYEGRISVGTFGETESLVHIAGTISADNKSWDAISEEPIAPKRKVRVKRVILEVEEVRSAF